MSLSNFSKNLRAAIEESRLTQVELAAQTSCTQSDISRYLSTNRIPSGDKLVELAMALGTSAERLITGRALATNAAPDQRPARAVRISPETLRLAKQAAEAAAALHEALKKME